MRIGFFFIVVIAGFGINACSDKDVISPVSKLDTLRVLHSMKGWELYSWPEEGKWKFSFLSGSNSIKTFSEVVSSDGPQNLIRVTGLDSVKLVLKKFPAGESIFMISQNWLQRAWGGQDHGNLQLPPQNIIDELRSDCPQKQLNLIIAN